MFEASSVAFVTGAGPGMGRAIAVGFASHGVDVVLAARRRERLETVAGEVRALGREALVVVADLADRDDCRAVVDQAVTRFGRLDHLVQNGHHPGDWAPVLDADPDTWQHIFAVNFFGAMHLIQAAVPVMSDPSVGHQRRHPGRFRLPHRADGGRLRTAARRLRRGRRQLPWHGRPPRVLR